MLFHHITINTLTHEHIPIYKKGKERKNSKIFRKRETSRETGYAIKERCTIRARVKCEIKEMVFILLLLSSSFPP
jgi:hypothetical protein